MYFDKSKIERNMGCSKEIIALTYDTKAHALTQDTLATEDAAKGWNCRCGGVMEGKLPDGEVNNSKPSSGNSSGLKTWNGGG